MTEFPETAPGSVVPATQDDDALADDALADDALAAAATSASEVESLVAALAEYADQIVFLERVVERTARSMRPKDLEGLVEEVRGFIQAEGAALNLEGEWLTPPPAWLARQPKPDKRIFALEQPAPAPARERYAGQRGEKVPETLVLSPFPGGYSAFWGKPGGFAATDLRLIDMMAQLIVPVLEAIRYRHLKAKQALEEHERRLAAQIWRTVIPEALPPFAGYRTSVLSRPAALVGGDFQFGAHGWAVVGDVSGKGMPAALFTGMFVASLNLALAHDDPPRALEQALYRELEKAEMFATVAAVRPLPDGRVEYFSFGHPPMLLRRADGRCEWLKATAPPMGTLPLMVDPLRSVQLAPGGLLCLYSDGLSEAERPAESGTRFFGEEGLTALFADVTRAAQVPDRVEAALADWSCNDDLTVVVLEYAPSDASTEDRSAAGSHRVEEERTW